MKLFSYETPRVEWAFRRSGFYTRITLAAYLGRTCYLCENKRLDEVRHNNVRIQNLGRVVVFSDGLSSGRLSWTWQLLLQSPHKAHPAFLGPAADQSRRLPCQKARGPHKPSLCVWRCWWVCLSAGIQKTSLHFLLSILVFWQLIFVPAAFPRLSRYLCRERVMTADAPSCCGSLLPTNRKRYGMVALFSAVSKVNIFIPMNGAFLHHQSWRSSDKTR